MINIYKVTRNVISGNEEEYRILKNLAEECGAIEIEDEIDLDSYAYIQGTYAKYYLEFTFDNVVDRDLFVMKVRKTMPDKFNHGES